MSKDRKAYFKRYYQLHKAEMDEKTRKWKAEHKEQEGTIDLYQTINELKSAEIEEFGAVGNAINWSKWKEVVNTTKEEIKDVLENYQPISKRKPIYVFVITSKEPLMKFETSDLAAEALGINRMLITNACHSHRPIKHKGIFLSYNEDGNQDL